VSPKTPPTLAPRLSAPARWQPDTGRIRKDRALFDRYDDARDPVDRETLVERYLPLALKLAGRYRATGEPLDDLFQVACLGLVNAIDRFDPERGPAFSSFAVPTILGELQRYFRDRTWAVRVPPKLQELSLRVDRAVWDLTVALHRPPTIAEISASVGARDEDVLEALDAAAARTAASLDAPHGGDDAGQTLGDTITIDDGGLRRAEDRADLAHLMGRISAREREVLRLRFEADQTQAEIGRRIGVSQMQISRIIRRALAHLQATADTHDQQTIAA
jgi:RNA polymerase sigma-B factor